MKDSGQVKFSQFSQPELTELPVREGKLHKFAIEVVRFVLWTAFVAAVLTGTALFFASYIPR